MKLLLLGTLRMFCLLILPILILIAYISQIEPYWIEVTHVNVPIENLPPAAPRFHNCSSE
jgi:hypothetical protein